MGIIGMFESTETCVNNLLKDAIGSHPTMACAVMDSFETHDNTRDWYIAAKKCGIFTTRTQICVPRDRFSQIWHAGKEGPSHIKIDEAAFEVVGRIKEARYLDLDDMTIVD